MNQKANSLAVLIALTGALCACTGATPPDPAAAPKAIEAYLQARVQADAEKMIALSCASWEATARIEATSAKSQQEELQGLACVLANSSGSTAAVACTGKILNSYNGEKRERNLAERPFQAQVEGGEWRMCGYK